MAALYLIPVTLGDSPLDRVLPSFNSKKVASIRHFIVEDVRSARRFLRKMDPAFDIDGSKFYPLNKHTDPDQVASYLEPLAGGVDMGVLSEAGCPAVADPGADVVAIAQRRGYKVVPLVGPSSIILGVMASGFNGQSFAFNGYLPIDSQERLHSIRLLETRSIQEKQTQIFIETPYRNNKLLEDLLEHLRPSTRLCVAANLTLEEEYIRTSTIQQWRKQKPQDLSKQPCIFLIYG